MYKCPNCGKKGISAWQKLNTGLLVPIVCKECGNKSGISYYGYFAIPLIIALNLSVRLIDYSIILKIVIWIAVTLIIGFIYLKYVPIVPRHNSKDI